MSEFTFDQNGATFSIKGPAGMTYEQAQAIFKQQTTTGSLVGFKVGDALSAATQAADGLPAAVASLSQSAASVTGKLPAGIDLSTITASIGTSGLSAAQQAQSSLGGSMASISSLATGSMASGATALNNITQNGVGALSSSVLNQSLTGQAGSLGSIANKAVTNISGIIKGTPVDGINTADFVKQLPALGGIKGLSQTDVTGTLAQASKLVGQSVDQVSNTLGVGKFGFDTNQLERAGMIKPGTTASFLAQGNKDLVDVLKSPTVWTGKDGVKGLDNLLNNPGAQDKIQQGLMASGLKDVKSLGIPIDKLNATALAGLATNAAKSVEGTMAWATNSPNMPQIPTVPGGDVKSAFDKAATNSAFAVKLSTDKIEPAVKQEEPVTPASNTVNADTVSAAANRIVGNEKVPSVVADGSVSAAKAAVYIYLDFIQNLYSSQASLEQNALLLTASSRPISQQQWNNLNEEFLVNKATYNARNGTLQMAMTEAVNSVPPGDNRANLVAVVQSAQKDLKQVVEQAFRIKKLIADLANKIST